MKAGRGTSRGMLHFEQQVCIGHDSLLLRCMQARLWRTLELRYAARYYAVVRSPFSRDLGRT